MRSGGATWARLRHELGLDRNPLRRRSDRIEALLLLLAIVAFVPLATVAAIAAAGWVHSAGVTEQRDGRSLTPVTADVIPPAPASAATPVPSALFWAQARWVSNGKVHTGLVPVPRGVRPGTTIRLWVDRNGEVRTPPPTTAQITGRVALVAVTTPPGVALGLFLALRALRRALDRRRIAAWERAWSVVGPRWTPKR